MRLESWIIFVVFWRVCSLRRWQKLSVARILRVISHSILQISNLLKNSLWQFLEIRCSRFFRKSKNLAQSFLERRGFGFWSGDLSNFLKRHRATCLDSRDFTTKSNRQPLDTGLCVFTYHLDSAVFISSEIVSFLAAPNKILARILDV